MYEDLSKSGARLVEFRTVGAPTGKTVPGGGCNAPEPDVKGSGQTARFPGRGSASATWRHLQVTSGGTKARLSRFPSSD
jgi:hypothetical protein